MSKLKKTILIMILVISVITTGMVFYFSFINLPKDSIDGFNNPLEFFCDNGKNHIDFQTDGNCAAYATAYVLRSLGEHTSGEKVSFEIKRIFGFVFTKSIVRVFEKHGFSSKAYHGDVTTLKQRLLDGIPIIVFIAIPNDTHYAVIVGYDEKYFYLVDSLPQNVNVDGNQYNRKLKIEEFERIWRTDTVFSDNIYIVVDK